MRNALFASLSLLVSSVSAISACQLDTRPQAVGVAGLGQDACTTHGICDSGVATGGSGKSGASGVAGRAVGSGGMGAVGTAGTSTLNGGVGGAGGMSLPDGGTTGPMLEVGQACTSDLQCKTAHCDGVCCAAGDCCATVADCKPTTVGGIQILCNDPGTCQGSGGAIQCVNSRCAATGAANDSACTSTMVANSCGAYLPVYCNGMADQQPPVCPTSCKSNADCKPNAHCDGTCVLNVDNGGACKKDADCTSTHCNNGICCASGDCCSAAAQCPPSYTGAPTCDTAATCQGTRKSAVCTNFQCSSELAQDDTGCGTTVLANDCGAKADIFCKGTKNQTTQVCGNTCTIDAQCDSGAYCQTSITPSTCQPKQANGTSCSGNGMCLSNSCSLANMICCDDTNGQCCSADSDCKGPTYNGMSCGANSAMCVGTTRTPKCRMGTCGAVDTPDPAPCNGTVNQCSAGYLAATCPVRCKTTCSTNADCAPNYTCIGAACQIPVPVAGTSAATGGTGGTAGVIALPTAGVLGLPP
jgi:hypothetical protein